MDNNAQKVSKITLRLWQGRQNNSTTNELLSHYNTHAYEITL
jgi:hypothetical protein